jgi:competence protein ComEC
LGYRARGRVARRSCLSCPRESGHVFFLCGFCAVFAGELSAALRTARVAAPVIAKIRIVTLEGFIEEMDFRRNGARFLLRVHSAEGLAPEQTPFRVRLSMRRGAAFRGRHLRAPKG